MTQRRPAIVRVLEDRTKERDRLLSERDALRSEAARTERARDSLRATLADVTDERNTLRTQRDTLADALRAMLADHAPTINGLCKICKHYGDDCTAHKARRVLSERGEV